MNVDVILFGLGVAGGNALRVCLRAGLGVEVVEEDQSTLQRVSDTLARGISPDFTGATTLPDLTGKVLIAASDMATPGTAPPLLILWGGPDSLVGCRHPSRTVAMDLSDPAFVEVSFGGAAAEARTIATGFLARIGAEMLPAVRDDQFAGTFLLDRALAMADRLMLAGIAPWEMDDALQEAGFTTGLLAAQDLIGLDVAYARRRRTGQRLLVSDRMVQEGRLGKSVGVGWYRYPGGGGAVIDPLMEDMIVEEARFAGMEREDMTGSQAAEALVLGLLNAAAVLMREGMTAPQVDVLAARKLGFRNLTAVARHWPAATLSDALQTLSTLDPALWTPDDGLEALTA